MRGQIILILVSLVFAGSYSEISREKVGNQEKVKLAYSNPGEFYLKATSPIHSYVTLSVVEESANELVFQISNEMDSFEIPHEFPFPYTKEKTGTPQYRYSLNKAGNLFSLERLDGTVLFKITKAEVLSLLYQELHVNLESQDLWGLGERRIENFKLSKGEYTTWTLDSGSLETHKKGGQQYGHHPVILQKINSQYHIALLRSSRPSTIEITDTEIIYRITGGIIEFKFLIGDTQPKPLVKAYHRYVNGWALHPFWASGWHQSRWGYESSQALKDVIANYDKAGIPIDTIWTDLDYMQDAWDFTLNTAKFPIDDIKSLTDLSKDQGVNWVPIIDPGVAVKSKCAEYLITSGAYIKSNRQNKTPLVGSVWPADVYFPDFNHPNAYNLWHQCFLEFQNTYGIKPRGVWIDMNELANFVDGEILPDPKPGKLNPDIFALEDLPWDAMGTNTLEGHTISIDGLHSSGGRFFKSAKDIAELDLHSFNGFLESIVTQESQAKLQGTQLTFILTRSSIFGSGRFVSHWFGDNASNYQWLRTSIHAMFNFNIFGIPFSGDDVCGFNDNTNAQLCARWHQLGAFYPFARNHNAIFQRPQEAYSFTESYVTAAAKASLKLRYALLKYYYTLFVTQRDETIGAGSGTIVDPLFYRYPEDQQATNVDDQFIIGDLVVIPIVTEQTKTDIWYTERQYYVPANALWYDLESGKKLNPGVNSLTRGFDQSAFVALIAGSVIVQSDVTNVLRSRNLPSSINLIVVLDASDKATGKYLSIQTYDDANIEQRCWSNGFSCARTLTVTLKNKVLTFVNTPESNDSSQQITINNVILYYQQEIKTIKVNVSSLTKQWQVSI